MFAPFEVSVAPCWNGRYAVVPLLYATRISSVLSAVHVIGIESVVAATTALYRDMLSVVLLTYTRLPDTSPVSSIVVSLDTSTVMFGPEFTYDMPGASFTVTEPPDEFVRVSVPRCAPVLRS